MRAREFRKYYISPKLSETKKALNMPEPTISHSHTAKGSPWTFFLITFGISWSIWLLGVLDATGLIKLQLSNSFYSLLNLIGGFGPTITCLMLLYYNEGKVATKELLRRAVNVKSIGKVWWLPIFILVPTIQVCALLLNMLSGGIVPELALLKEPWLIPVYFIIALLPFANPIREEFGWRGYALDRLQLKWNALVSSVILGFTWGVWHLPLFVFPTSQAVYGYIPLWVFIPDTITISIFMTWIYNNSSRSILSAIVFHAVVNLSGQIFLYYQTEFGVYYNLLLEVITAIVIVAIFGYKTMVRSTKQ